MLDRQLRQVVGQFVVAVRLAVRLLVGRIQRSHHQRGERVEALEVVQIETGHVVEQARHADVAFLVLLDRVLDRLLALVQLTFRVHQRLLRVQVKLWSGQ